jgi:hypothetical protein
VGWGRGVRQAHPPDDGVGLPAAACKELELEGSSRRKRGAQALLRDAVALFDQKMGGEGVREPLCQSLDKGAGASADDMADQAEG